jgi:LPXTG-site transpeptidase (sortase) family protein
MNKPQRVLLLIVMVLLGASACTTNGAAPFPTPALVVPTAEPATPIPDTPQPASLAAATAAPTLAPPTLAPPTVAPPTAVPPTARPALPRLIIPELEVDQPIIPILIKDGAWDMAPLEEQVGWLTTTGERPGDDLAMALAGHINIALGRPGPFLNIVDLKPGDEVLYRRDGVDYVYAVRGTEKVEPDAVQQLYVPNGKQLLLVTCSDWSYFWSRYARRLIVTADLVSTEDASY